MLINICYDLAVSGTVAFANINMLYTYTVDRLTELFIGDTKLLGLV